MDGPKAQKWTVLGKIGRSTFPFLDGPLSRDSKFIFLTGLFVDEFYFRWLENSVTVIEKAAGIPLMFHFLNWNLSESFLIDNFSKIRITKT